jgi:hypothetical protein
MNVIYYFLLNWHILLFVNNKILNKHFYFFLINFIYFTKHRVQERKQRYIIRHKKRENWKDPTTASFWSLWNKTTITESLADTKKRFKLKPETF